MMIITQPANLGMFQAVASKMATFKYINGDELIGFEEKESLDFYL
jgi:hypothetical protein